MFERFPNVRRRILDPDDERILVVEGTVVPLHESTQIALPRIQT